MPAKTTNIQKSASSIDNKFIEFLSEDFRDTSTHLKETDRKIEFTFQLYAGGLALISSAGITFLGTALGSNNLEPKYNVYILSSLIISLVIVWLFTKWAFSYSIKGTKMKLLYINRMNFLRKEIYEHLGASAENTPTFFYTRKIPPRGLQNIGMLDMYPIAFQNILIYLPFLIGYLLYNLLNLLMQFNWMYGLTVIFVVLVTAKFIHKRLKKDWEKIVLETKDKIEELWISPGNS